MRTGTLSIEGTQNAIYILKALYILKAHVQGKQLLSQATQRMCS